MTDQTSYEALLDLLSRPGHGSWRSWRSWRPRVPTLAEDLSLGALGAIVVLSALCGTSVLFLLNTEARLIEYKGYSTLIAVLFVVVLMIYRFTQRMLISRAGRGIESALHRRRTRITDKVLRLSLRDVEDLESGRVMDGLSAHYAALSQAAVPLIAGVEGLVLMVFMYVYLVILSPAAGLLTAAIVAVTAVGYLSLNNELDRTLAETGHAGERHRRFSEAVIEGAKELRLHAGKRDALEADMQATSETLADSRSASAVLFAQVISTGTSVSYLMAGGVVFALPILSGTGQDDISRIVMAVLFLIGPIGSVVNSVHHYSIARFKMSAIDSFEDAIDRCLACQTDVGAVPDAPFETLGLVCASYEHRADAAEPGFALRDLSLTVRRGEIVFITGGNGSGKTTALRVLTGLYPRSSGRITLNGQDMPAWPPKAYRNLFSCVFADFHVFPKPYALDDAGRDRLRHWLRVLEIEAKLPANLDELHPERLSTGQRKRLALALGLAEARPVLILDEWAADQDPATRERFYTVLLPELKASGLTVIAVTHDDRYFDCADRRYHMTEGTIEMMSA